MTCKICSRFRFLSSLTHSNPCAIIPLLLLSERYGMAIQKTVLHNGLTVATDYIPNFETVSVGIFVKVGSVNETENLCGVSHFVEHMAFKGTERRTSLQISESIESAGGHMNAYTGKETTAFYAKVLKSDIELAVDVITDIVQNSTFDRAEFEVERGVIIQEIKQTNDTPDDVVFEIFQHKCFENEALGRQILGNIANIKRFQPQDLKNYLKSNYSASKMILAASGNVNHDEFVRLAEKYTDKIHDFETKSPDIQKYSGGFIHRQKDLEQRHIILGYEGGCHKSDIKYDLFILSTILGGGMSSRLFQEVREKRGLAYSVFSYIANYNDTGIFGVYAGCEIDKALDVIKVIRNEMSNAVNDISDDEVAKAKRQIKASLLMGLESSSARMERLANQYLLYNRFFSSDEIIAFIDAVNVDSARDVLNSMINTKPTLAVVGSDKNIEILHDAIFK